MGKNRTDRGQPGAKKSLLVEGDSGPLGVVAAGVNVPNFKRLEETIGVVVVERPDPEGVEPHRCRDAGLDNSTARGLIEGQGDLGHIRPAREGPARSGARAAARPAAGWWSGRWGGCRSAGRCWSATTSMRRTSWG